jgi:hypothetical protein
MPLATGWANCYLVYTIIETPTCLRFNRHPIFWCTALHSCLLDLACTWLVFLYYSFYYVTCFSVIVEVIRSYKTVQLALRD